VKRYKKFCEQLPKAKDDRQQLLDSLDQTPVHERQQLVQQLKEELQSMAQGMGPAETCHGWSQFQISV
jgi:prefoldin subunit 5